MPALWEAELEPSPFGEPRPSARAGARGRQPRAADRPSRRNSRSPACSSPCCQKQSCPWDGPLVQLFLCKLQQFGEIPQKMSLSKTARICTQASGAQHVLGSGTETKQRPIPRKEKKGQEKFSSPLLASSTTAVVVCHSADLTMRKTWPFCRTRRCQTAQL